MGNPAGVRRDFDALEKRRFAAMHLLDEGVNQSEVARRVKVARQTVARWAQECRSKGKRALKKAGRAGRKPLLKDKDRKRLARKGTKPAAYFSHICSSATRNACSGAAAVIGPACRQVNDLSPFWSARFGLRRFLCLLLLEVTHEQLRKRDLHEASVSDRNHHFFMRLVRR